MECLVGLCTGCLKNEGVASYPSRLATTTEHPVVTGWRAADVNTQLAADAWTQQSESYKPVVLCRSSNLRPTANLRMNELQPSKSG